MRYGYTMEVEDQVAQVFYFFSPYPLPFSSSLQYLDLKLDVLIITLNPQMSHTLGGARDKHRPAMQETRVRFPGYA